MSFFKWSRTAASDATADSTINWAEGQSPSSVNDSGRAMMAAAAKFRDDVAGAIASGGTSTAYTVASYQSFDTLPHLSGNMIAFTPHATNGATVTLNVDGLGAAPLRSAPSVELSAGVLVQGTPYLALYNNSTSEFLLHGFFGSSLTVPLGAMLDFVGTTAPNSNFVLPFGQAISRTTYATLFALTATTYGAGDGLTTFNIPDLRGRVVACLDNAGGTTASRVTFANSAITGTVLGSAGGAETVTLVTGNLPPYTPAGANSAPTITNHRRQKADGGAGTVVFTVDAGNDTSGTSTADITASAPTFTGTAQGGLSTPVNKMSPTIILNKLLRVL